MSIQTQWLLEPSVLLQRFQGSPSLNEYGDASQDLSRFMPRNRQAKLHVLGDFSELNEVPYDIPGVAEDLNNAIQRSQISWFVTYGSSDVAINFAAALMPYLSRIQHKHFRNQEEAFDFLSMMDASLPIFA